LQVLSGVSVLLFVVLFLLTRFDLPLAERFAYLWSSGRLWTHLGICLIPLATGVYYWALLREEEITVTDISITRRSHWGDELIEWTDVLQFRRQPIPFRDTRLGRIASLGRLFKGNERLWDRMPLSYELIGSPDKHGNRQTMRLEPGTIDDMPWLLQLIEERLGPASAD
jgi:hypothetical protein